MIKEDPGLIVLNAANTCDGGTTINGGTLRFASLTSDLVPTFPTNANNQASKTLMLGGTSGLIPNTTLGRSFFMGVGPKAVAK